MDIGRLLRGEASSRPAESAGPDAALTQPYALAVEKLLRLTGSEAANVEGIDAEAELKQWVAATRCQRRADARARSGAHQPAQFYRNRGNFQQALDTYDQVRVVMERIDPKVAPYTYASIATSAREFLAEINFQWRDYEAAERSLRGSLDMSSRALDGRMRS